jgi:hypothetical protein
MKTLLSMPKPFLPAGNFRSVTVHAESAFCIEFRSSYHRSLEFTHQLTMSRVKAALGRSGFFTTPSPIAVDKSETGSPLDTQQPIS